MNLATSQDIEALRRAIEALAARIDGATIVPAPEWVSVADAARRLGVSAQTVRRWISRGEIEARGHGRLRRVRVE
ncbi:MAG: helix-turn-helix domain-containing protein [Rhodobacteraceae bacterium]|nr:helix-turn-helix domain-containing protein [Paracoccaceae bacterium]